MPCEAVKLRRARIKSAKYGGPGLIVVFFQEIGQFTDTIVDAFKFGMGVSHGHAEVGVTHGLLDDGDGYALLGENYRNIGGIVH